MDARKDAADDLYEALKAIDYMYCLAWDTTKGEIFFSERGVAAFEKAHSAARLALAKADGRKIPDEAEDL